MAARSWKSWATACWRSFAVCRAAPRPSLAARRSPRRARPSPRPPPPPAAVWPRYKEFAHRLRSAALGDAGVDLGPVMAGRLVEDARTVLDTAAFRIVGGEIKPADAGKTDRRGAHRARLQGDIKIAIGEALRAELGG